MPCQLRNLSLRKLSDKGDVSLFRIFIVLLQSVNQRLRLSEIKENNYAL